MANSTAAQLNTLAEQLKQEDTRLRQGIGATQLKLEVMRHENIFKKIRDGFKVLFGHLEQDLYVDVAQMRHAELGIEINSKTISALTQMASDMGDIASVASALEVSWRNLGDSIGDLGQDLADVAGISASDWNSELDDVKSDWQYVLQIVANVQG